MMQIYSGNLLRLKNKVKLEITLISVVWIKNWMDTLENCYKNANEWDSRRQIFSIMADKVSLSTIRQWIPGLTRYRFMVATQHAAVHGSGNPVPINAQTKSVIPEAKLAHFLDFITGSHVILDLPFGAKTITLSTERSDPSSKCGTEHDT